MTGTCTECGLCFVWAEVLVPQKFEPRWCVEFTRPPQRFAWACLGTILRSALPLRFWSALNMSMPVRPARLAAYLAVLVLPVLLSGIIVQTAAAIRVRQQTQRRIIIQQGQARGMLASLQRRLTDPALTPASRSVIQQQLVQTQQFSTGTSSINHSYPAAIAEAVLLPWRSRSWGTVNFWGGPQPYTAPRYLHLAAMGQSGRGSSFLNLRAPVFMLTGILVAIWITVTMPLAFVLLPVSRRRAKVRSAHLLRVGCYGLAVGSVLVAAILLCVAIGYTVNGLQPASLAAAHLLGLYGIALVTIVWWAVAIRCYLHIPHGWAVAPMLAFLLLLLLMTGAWLVVSNLPQ